MTRNAPLEAGRRETRGHGCAVCFHEKRDEIDRELTARVFLGKLSTKYGMSRASLSRHRTNHVSKALVALRPALPIDATTLQQLEDQARRVEAFFTAAEKDGHGDQLVNGSRELRLLREAIAKRRGELNGPPPAGVNIQRSEEWHAIRAIIWEVLEPHDDLRVAIGKRLLALDAKEKT